MEYKKPIVNLLHCTPLWIAEVAGRSCYNSFSLSENKCVQDFPINNTPLEYDITGSELVDKLVNVHFHESVIEHVNISLHMKNISREIIIELNRHRIGIATSQMSTRYTIESLVNAFLAIYGTVPVNNASSDKDSDFYKIVASNIVHNNITMINHTVDYMYKMLCNYHSETPLVAGLTGGKKKKQNDYVKRMLVESWMTEGVWTFNLRALKHLFELRLSGAAYYGIRDLVLEITNVLPHKYRVLIDKRYRQNIKEAQES